MMTAMAISPMMRNVLIVATTLSTDVMASDTATIAPTPGHKQARITSPRPPGSPPTLGRGHQTGRRRRQRACRHHGEPGLARADATVRRPSRYQADPPRPRPARHWPQTVRPGSRELHRQYATKALDVPGLPDRPLRSAHDLVSLTCHRHYKQMITTSRELGGGHHILLARVRGTAWEPWGGKLVPGGVPAVRGGLMRSAWRPLPHQIPPLLHHLRPIAPRPPNPPPRLAPAPRRTRPVGDGP